MAIKLSITALRNALLTRPDEMAGHRVQGRWRPVDLRNWDAKTLDGDRKPGGGNFRGGEKLSLTRTK
jgi:hypothetical protein